VTTESGESRNLRALFGGVCLTALATLLFEVTLIRVLSFTIWYHFAYVVISTALLGFGASGTVLAVWRGIGRHDLRASLSRFALFAAVTVPAVLALVAYAGLDPMEITSRPDQTALFIVYEAATTIPFFFSGLAISLALRAAADRIDRLYFWDLVGAGLGCAGAVPLMNILTPPGATLVSAAGFGAAAAAFAPTTRQRSAALALGGVMLVGSLGGARIPFTPANSKHLAMHIKYQNMVPVSSHWTALFRTDVVADQDNKAGFTNSVEWGLSAAVPYDAQHPSHFVTHDGTAGTAMYDLRATSTLDFLDYHILRFPYLITPAHPQVLVIGVGGGRDVITAIHYGAGHVTGIELDPVTVELIRTDMNDVMGGFFQRPDVTLVAGEGRHFIKGDAGQYDLIQLTGVDTLSAEFSGAYVLAENYLYTAEAFHDYLDHLTPDGSLSITTGELLVRSPKASGRMVAVAQQVLRERGVARPQDHIAVIDSRHLFVEVLVRLKPFDQQEVDRLLQYCQQLQFDPILLPGHDGLPVFRELASLTGGERDTFLAGLKYDLSVTTDDQPFFFKFFRWGDLLGSEPLSPVHTTALGQIVLLLLLVSLTLLGAVFVLGPLVAFRRRGISGGGRAPLGILLYFLAIGVGFMLFEISLIQRFVLFLGYPTYSLTVTLSALLASLGCGSFLSRRLVGSERTALPLAVVMIGLLTAFYMRGLPIIQAHSLGTPLFLRICVTIALLAPLGLVLGVFFPLGIRRAAAVHEDLVPWAWGVNGCASVTATVLAVILAMSYGFAWVWTLSVGIYALGVAALLLTTPAARSTSELSRITTAGSGAT